MSNISGTLFVQTLTCGAFTPPPGCITDNAIQAGADIDTSKLMHRFQPVYCQPVAATVSAETKIVHVVYGSTATLNTVEVGLVTANIGAATITVDVYVNGSSILVTPLTITNSLTAYTITTCDISNQNLVMNNVLEVVVTASASGGTIGKGLFVCPQIDENAN